MASVMIIWLSPWQKRRGRIHCELSFDFGIPSPDSITTPRNESDIL
jgi:hypothetical protein